MHKKIIIIIIIIIIIVVVVVVVNKYSYVTYIEVKLYIIPLIKSFTNTLFKEIVFYTQASMFRR